jgi:hypothetical protein
VYKDCLLLLSNKNKQGQLLKAEDSKEQTKQQERKGANLPSCQIHAYLSSNLKTLKVFPLFGKTE